MSPGFKAALLEPSSWYGERRVRRRAPSSSRSETGVKAGPRFPVGDEPAFLGHLAWVIPELRPVVARHLTDNAGVLLPHLLMADFERWAEAALGRDDDSLRRFLEELDEAFPSGHKYLRDLITDSFLEMLPQPNEPGAELRSKLGPHLSAWLLEWDKPG